MGIGTFLGFGFGSDETIDLPVVFNLPVAQDAFVQTDLENIFTKILTDVLDRTSGIKDDLLPLFFDNCVKSESADGDGLITMIAKAMSRKEELFIVYDKTLHLVRRATNAEATQIKDEYSKGKQQAGRAYLSFKNFTKADQLRFYGGIEYGTIGGLYKSANLSRALQFKIKNLRGSVALTDASEAKAQVKNMATSLSKGKDIYMDGEDMVETATPDVAAAKEAGAVTDAKKCFLLGYPLSYITGEAPKGLGDSGEGDAKAIERGHKSYYFSIVKPALLAIFDLKTKFKSQDFRQLSSALEALKTFDLVGEKYISEENKLLIVNTLLDVDSELGEDPEPEIPPVVPGANVPPNPNDPKVDPKV